MNAKNKPFIILIAVAFAFSVLASQAFAASATMDANVTISSVSEISVKPTILNWTNVALGAVGGNKTLTVENTGSVNVTDLYAYPDTVTDEGLRPYGNDSANAYSTGSVLTLSNFTIAQYFFMGRLEWNWTEAIQNLNTTNLNSPVSAGFFKNNSREYVWAAGNGTDGLCNNTGAQFAVEDDQDTGTMASRTPEIGSITNNFQDANYSYFSVSRGSSPLDGYCVAVNSTCAKIYIYKYDKRTGFTQCTNSKYITSDQLAPGHKMQLGVDVFVPRGLPAGELNRATVTFVAT
jgi:hypothetical protein